MATIQAVSGKVTGQDQHVGFRAMIMKQAIEYNLAGFAINEPNDIVRFTLQGHENRLADALDGIKQGTSKSDSIKVVTDPTAVAAELNTFTIFGWTSTSREITRPYDLVFTLRTEDDNKVSADDAKVIWHDILKSTLKGADLEKLGEDD